LRNPAKKKTNASKNVTLAQVINNIHDAYGRFFKIKFSEKYYDMSVQLTTQYHAFER